MTRYTSSFLYPCNKNICSYHRRYE